MDVRVIRDFQVLETVLKSRLQAGVVKLVTFRLTRPLDRKGAELEGLMAENQGSERQYKT